MSCKHKNVERKVFQTFQYDYCQDCKQEVTTSEEVTASEEGLNEADEISCDNAPSRVAPTDVQAAIDMERFENSTGTWMIRGYEIHTVGADSFTIKKDGRDVAYIINYGYNLIARVEVIDQPVSMTCPFVSRQDLDEFIEGVIDTYESHHGIDEYFMFTNVFNPTDGIFTLTGKCGKISKGKG